MKIQELTQTIRQRVSQQTAALAARSQELRERAEMALDNAGDRFLRAEKLTLANQTPYQVLHDDGLIQ